MIIRKDKIQMFVVRKMHSIIPTELRNAFILFSLGALTTTETLADQEVPLITIDQIIEAMKREEGQNAPA
jgi:fluoride ion exporter CrcB/FEX